MAYEISLVEPLSEEIQRNIAERIESAIEAVSFQTDGRSAAAHAARKNCKKIRALLRLIRGPLGSVYKTENAWYRDAGRELSEIRDAGSLIEAFDAMFGTSKNHKTRAETAELDVGALAAIREHLVLRQPEFQIPSAAVTQRFDDFAKHMRVGLERTRTWPQFSESKQKVTTFDALSFGFERIYEQAKLAMKVAHQDPTLENVHSWRKRVKDHGYHVQLLTKLWTPILKRKRIELSKLGDYLGDEHDLGLLAETISHDGQTWCDSDSHANIVRSIETRRQMLRLQAFRLGSKLFCESPKAIGKRFRCYWKVTAGLPKD